MWFPAYEAANYPDVEVTTVVGDAMPKNRESQIAEIISLVTSVPPLITLEMAQQKLAELGYEYPATGADALLADAAALATARGLADPFSNRYNAERAPGTPAGAFEALPNVTAQPAAGGPPSTNGSPTPIGA
jgi:hypothetical protein